MAEPVTEALAVARGGDPLARHGVDVLRANAIPDGGERGLLRLAHDLVYLARLLARLTGGEGASAVGAVAVELRTHVEDDELPPPDLTLAGLGMGQRPVRPGGDDRRERGLGTELPHSGFGGAGDLVLAATGEAALERPAPDLVGEVRRRLDRGE